MARVNRTFRLHSIRNEFVAALVATIFVSAAAAYVGNWLLAHNAVDEMVAQNDLAIARTMANDLGVYYERTGSWAQVRNEIGRIRSTSQHQTQPDGTPHKLTDEAPMLITDTSGAPVYNGFSRKDRELATSFPDHFDTKLGAPITASGQLVGYIFFKTMVLRIYDPGEERFIGSLNTALGLSLGVQVCLALVLGLILASRFVRPITSLEAAVKKIAEGKAHDHVPVVGKNEIASLSSHFNQMVDQLQAQEQSRRNLFADVAHELRTPVSILQANLEMMIEGVYPADRERLVSLHEETQLLTKLIGDLRTISDLELGITGGKLEPVPLAGIVEECCLKYQPLYREKGVTLTLESQGTPRVLGDAHRLGQVLKNVLDNALKYASDGPEVVVRLAVTDGKNPRARVTVSDQGPGVQEGELGKLFDRFYRSEQSRNRELGGRGLGLAISKQFIEACGGTVGAENRSPRGLSLWFELPVL